jgi:hypothetical protein
VSAIEWPPVGSQWVDATGRTLHVTAVQPESRIGRHVVGELLLGERRQAYACDLPTFDAVWRERRLWAGEDGGDHRPRQALGRDLTPLKRAK